MALFPTYYTNEQGEERVIWQSDKGMKVERDGEMWDSADDYVWQRRTYTETNIPIDPESDSDELTLSDALGMLSEFGVNTEEGETDDQ
ncbi:MAG: hypothetical protein IJH32_10115 [Ruminococcus sp.]|nr:hypothetical protein [Ruminococcus sp.]